MEKSCQVIEILFWIGIGIVFYTYLGYGIIPYGQDQGAVRKTPVPPPSRAAAGGHVADSRLQRGGDRGEQDGELQTTGLSGG